MFTIVAEADGLIKLGKSGVLPDLLGASAVVVPRAVWEAVQEGKRGMHEDAHDLERVLLSEPGGAEIVDVGEGEVAPPSAAASLGDGELAALAVFRVRGADAVLTDDRAFLGLLAGYNPPVPTLTPAAAIAGLAEGGHLAVGAAREALGRIECALRADAFRAATTELEAMERAEESKE